MLRKRLDLFNESIMNTQCTKDNQIVDINQALIEAYELIHKVTTNNGVVYVIGNGGSASIASHFSIDLIKALGIPCLTLSDSSALTCLSNDLGYENVFSSSLKVILKPNDLLIAISSSGQSINILKAINIANEVGAKKITFSGFLDDNPLRQTGDLNFYIEQSDYGIVEIGHSFILHSLVDLWKAIQNIRNVKMLGRSEHAK